MRFYSADVLSPVDRSLFLAGQRPAQGSLLGISNLFNTLLNGAECSNGFALGLSEGSNFIQHDDSRCCTSPLHLLEPHLASSWNRHLALQRLSFWEDVVSMDSVWFENFPLLHFDDSQPLVSDSVKCWSSDNSCSVPRIRPPSNVREQRRILHEAWRMTDRHSDLKANTRTVRASAQTK